MCVIGHHGKLFAINIRVSLRYLSEWFLVLGQLRLLQIFLLQRGVRGGCQLHAQRPTLLAFTDGTIKSLTIFLMKINSQSFRRCVSRISELEKSWAQNIWHKKISEPSRFVRVQRRRQSGNLTVSPTNNQPEMLRHLKNVSNNWFVTDLIQRHQRLKPISEPRIWVPLISVRTWYWLQPSVRLAAVPPSGLMATPLTRCGCALPRPPTEAKPALG